jgi:hypothetical protein
MPIWEIRDSNGNVHSVDLAKANLKSVNDIEDLVKNEFKKFDEKKAIKALQNAKNGNEINSVLDSLGN